MFPGNYMPIFYMQTRPPNQKITETEVLIGNNLGKTNGWISKKDVIAKVIKVHQD